MKRIIQIVTALLLLAGITQAAIVTDNFDRVVAEQTSTSDPNLIGENYVIESGLWSCNGYLNAGAQGIMIDTSLQTSNAGGDNFTLSADVLTVASATSARAGGLVFNYQDADNYYLLRYNVFVSGSDANIQLVKREGGVNSQLDLYNAPLNQVTYYTLSVSSSGSTFDVGLSLGGSVIYSNSVSDSTFTGGYAGFVREGSGTVRFDNYSLEVVPEPATIGLFGIAMVGVLAVRRLRG